jgi:hypothetical protein
MRTLFQSKAVCLPLSSQTRRKSATGVHRHPYFRLGSKPELPTNGLMSAPASCGHRSAGAQAGADRRKDLDAALGNQTGPVEL